eukprot:NODE_2910_length_856_cov_242.732834.p2 GENE.NODE_2910_length_856_cov_242.732834~~NODE_2910_length_856_cov_242.732834.p2  ORF type:complete len:228 (-),score=49.63 NODE_2910_length_856_cov_242.732834:124-807(-)
MDSVIRGDPYGAFGEVQRVTGAFSISSNDSFFADNIRASAEGDPLGCMGDLGWYCIRFGLFAFGYDAVPTAVSARKVKDASERGGGAGVPIDMTCEVYYDEARTRMLSFHCSFCHPFRQWIEVVGSNSILRLDDFVLAKHQSRADFVVERAGGLMDVDSMVSTATETVSTHDCIQELEMIREFSEIVVKKGPLEEFWPAIAMATQRVIDGALLSASKGGELVPLGCC